MAAEGSPARSGRPSEQDWTGRKRRSGDVTCAGVWSRFEDGHSPDLEGPGKRHVLRWGGGEPARGWGTAVKPQEGPPRTGSKSPRQRGPQGAPAASTASGRFQGSLNTRSNEGKRSLSLKMARLGKRSRARQKRGERVCGGRGERGARAPRSRREHVSCTPLSEKPPVLAPLQAPRGSLLPTHSSLRSLLEDLRPSTSELGSSSGFTAAAARRPASRSPCLLPARSSV